MKKTILIIDDEASVVQTLGIVLSTEYAIKSFIDAYEALAYLDDKPEIAFVIIDCWIGKVNGVDLFKKDIAPRYPKVPAILISAAYNRDSIMRTDIEKYFICDIEKPFDLLKLRDIIQKHIS